MISRWIVITWTAIVATVVVVVVISPDVYRAVETGRTQEIVTNLGWAILVMSVVGVVWALVCSSAEPSLAGARVTISANHVLTVHTKKFFRAPVAWYSFDLADVRYLSWVIALAVGEGDAIAFWDRDPELRFDFIGPAPRDSGLKPIGYVDIGWLKASPAAEQHLREYLAARIVDGTFDTNVDLDTWKPIKEKRPPLAPGVTIHPHGALGGTEIRYTPSNRSEQRG